MQLYDIDERLLYLMEEGFDTETGEILEGFDLKKALDEVNMELTEKIENIACYYKSLIAKSEAIKKEKLLLEQRQRVTNNEAERLKKYLDGYFRYSQSDYFEGNKKFKKFETPKCVISYRKSNSIQIKDVDKVPSSFINEHKLTEKDVDKTKLKEYLKTHEEPNDFAEIVENKNIGIK